MNTFRTRWAVLWIILGALLAVALACGPLSALQPAKPTPTLIVLPTLPGASTSGGNAPGGSAPGGNAPPLTFTRPDKSSLTSFHEKFTLNYNGTDSSGKPVQGSFSMDQSRTTTPAAYSITWSGQDTNGKNSSFAMTQIGDSTYMVTAESGSPKCIAMTSSNNTQSQNVPFSPDTYLTGSDLSKARQLPDDNVNGVPVHHYQFTNTDLLLSYGGWTNYTVDVWNAVQGNYTVKATFSGDGKEATFNGGQGHLEWSYELSDVNAAINIQPPQGCSAPAGSEFPKMPDAADVVSMGAMTTYSTASPIADVVTFYNAQLPPQGWVAGTADTSNPAMATLEFTKGAQKASITITQANGKTTVLITIQ